MAVSISATGLKGEAAMKIHGEVLFRVQGLGLCKGLLQKDFNFRGSGFRLARDWRFLYTPPTPHSRRRRS